MRVFGTYLHGLFDHDPFRHQFLRAARAAQGLAAPNKLCQWRQLREQSLDRLANEVEKALDMKKIFGWVGLSYEGITSAAGTFDVSQEKGLAR
jgi:adenosylcobyric acid synthase